MKTQNTELVTLTNSFHNTSTRVRVPAGTGDPWLWLCCEVYEGIVSPVHSEQYARSLRAKRVMRRVRKTLCGNTDCKCGVVRP